MNLGDHHEWIDVAATRLLVSGDTLWQAMCAEWATESLAERDAARIVESIQDALAGIGMPAILAPPPPVPPRRRQNSASPNVQQPLFDR